MVTSLQKVWWTREGSKHPSGEMFRTLRVERLLLSLLCLKKRRPRRVWTLEKIPSWQSRYYFLLHFYWLGSKRRSKQPSQLEMVIPDSWKNFSSGDFGHRTMTPAVLQGVSQWDMRVLSYNRRATGHTAACQYEMEITRIYSPFLSFSRSFSSSLRPFFLSQYSPLICLVQEVSAGVCCPRCFHG